MERSAAREVRTGPAYEADRLAARARLAGVAGARRIALGLDLVLVFETSATVRMALEELLRTERINEPERVVAETVAFEALLGDAQDVAATLYVDVADPVDLAERLSALAGVERAVTLDVGGRPSAGRPDPADVGSGAFHLLFALDEDQWAALRAGASVAVRVEHEACRAETALGTDLARALASTDG